MDPARCGLSVAAASPIASAMRLRSPALPVSILALAVAACAGPPPPTPSPPPARFVPPPPRPVPPPPTGDWRDWPLTPGTWSYRRDDRGSLALFGRPGDEALLTLRCDTAARRIYFSRAGSAPGPLTIRTSSMTRTLPVQPTGGAVPYVALALAPADPLLDAIGFSRGRFVVEQAGAPTLVAPAWAEIERVTEDCRG